MNSLNPKKAWLARTFGEHCVLCGATENLTIDHIFPKGRGGMKRRVENLQLLCRECNFAKANTVLPWMEDRERWDVRVLRGREPIAAPIGVEAA